jgi:O-antigen ligase
MNLEIPEETIFSTGEDKKVPLFFVFLVPFIILAISVAAMPYFNNLVKLIGVIAVIGFILASLQKGIVFPKEVICFCAYFALSIVGSLNARSLTVFWSRYFTLFQVAIMVLMISNNSINLKSARFLIYSFLTGMLIVAFSGYVTGDYKRAIVEDTERLTGFGLNANSFSMMLVLSNMLFLYFIKTTKSTLMKLVFVVIVLIFVGLIIASGSRTGFVSLAILIPIWFFFSFKKEILERPHFFFLALILVSILAVFIFKRVQNTFLAERLLKSKEVVAAGGGYGSTGERMSLIEEGIELVKSHPLTGIGLNNFRFHSSSGLYSHNNYIEVFSGSGLIIGMQYYLVFLFLWLRTRRLGKIVTDRRAKETVNLIKTFILLVLISDLAAVTYFSKAYWILFSIFIGWTYHTEKSLKSENLQYFEDDYSHIEDVPQH